MSREDLHDICRIALSQGGAAAKIEAINGTYLSACEAAGLPPKEAADILQEVAAAVGVDLQALARQNVDVVPPCS